jgi:hypothetical protein
LPKNKSAERSFLVVINHFASIHGLTNHKCDRVVGNDFLLILVRFGTIRDHEKNGKVNE